jgi:hypothetical protein
MKKILLLCSGLLFGMTSAQVGIGTSTPQPSSILDVNVNNLPIGKKKGLLLPQVPLTSNIDVATIPNPAHGLLVINTADAGVGKNTVYKDNIYKYNAAIGKWEFTLDENALVSLKMPMISTILSFNKTGNDTTYLGPDLGSSIRQVQFDDVRLESSAMTYDMATKELVANKTGYYNFQINLVFRGAYNGQPRIGLSKPYTGAKPTFASNATFAFLSQNGFNVSSSMPVPMSSSGLIFMNAGEKVIILTRYITPAVNTLNVESINYDRTLVNSVAVTYYSN